MIYRWTAFFHSEMSGQRQKDIYMDVRVSIHDQHQMELKLNYPLPGDRRRTLYELNLYFFAPYSLGVHPQTYSKQQFYTDLQSYIRIRTPSVPLNRLKGSETSPMAQLRGALERKAQQPSERPLSEFEEQIKLFCCIFKSAVRDYVAYIHNTVYTQDRDRLIGDYLATVQDITAGYRELQRIIQIPNIDQRTFEIYLFGDEYISLLVEDHTYHLLNALSTNDSGLSPENRKKLLALIDGEVNYRRRRRYASIPEELKDNETLVFRRSVLKKYVASILFLNKELKTEWLLLQQVFFGLAAAAAMLFATAAAFISQTVYGSLTFPVFVTLVVSYIFKDRIKDLLRYHLSRKMTRFLFDHKTRVRDVAGKIVGVCRESFGFVKDRKLPADVRELRNRDHITEIENGWVGENILLYRKRIRLHPERVRRIFSEYEVAGVNDIMRFNVQEFLRRMDDPKKELFVMDDEGYHRIKGARVYHLNMIVRMTFAGRGSHMRFRVVLNREGIKRIEHVKPR
jgi:hypothetical protein